MHTIEKCVYMYMQAWSRSMRDGFMSTADHATRQTGRACVMQAFNEIHFYGPSICAVELCISDKFVINYLAGSLSCIWDQRTAANLIGSSRLIAKRSWLTW